MKKPKLTPWSSPDCPPERVGAYQACHAPSECKWAQQGYQFWDGKKWGAYNFDPAQAELEKDVRSAWQRVYWRGLASDPKASKS